MTKAATRFQFHVEKFQPGKVRVYFLDRKTGIRLCNTRAIKRKSSFKKRW
jgi:hypothetical protein